MVEVEKDEPVFEIGFGRRSWHRGDQVAFCDDFKHGADRIRLADDVHRFDARRDHGGFGLLSKKAPP